MIGCFVFWKCFVACLFFESSQQPTWPHDSHKRKCSQVSPVFKQSSQPFAPGVTARISPRCVHDVTTFQTPFIERTSHNSATMNNNAHLPPSEKYPRIKEQRHLRGTLAGGQVQRLIGQRFRCNELRTLSSIWHCCISIPFNQNSRSQPALASPTSADTPAHP